MTSVFSAVGAKLKAQQQHKHEQQKAKWQYTATNIYTWICKAFWSTYRLPAQYHAGTVKRQACMYSILRF